MARISSLSQYTLPLNPTAALESATKSYVDLAQWPHPNDANMYGDTLGSVNRSRVTNFTSLSNGFYTLSMVVVPRSLTGITKVRFFVGVAGSMPGVGTGVSLSLYSGATPSALPLVAGVPSLAQSSFTSTGVKELALSATLSLTAGQYLAWMTYIPAMAFVGSPGLGCTAVTYTALINAGANYSAYKAAAVTAPSTLDATSGWTTDTNVPWWSVL